jgi:hypothetical protein
LQLAEVNNVLAYSRDGERSSAVNFRHVAPNRPGEVIDRDGTCIPQLDPL